MDAFLRSNPLASVSTFHLIERAVRNTFRFTLVGRKSEVRWSTSGSLPIVIGGQSVPLHDWIQSHKFKFDSYLRIMHQACMFGLCRQRCAQSSPKWQTASLWSSDGLPQIPAPPTVSSSSPSLLHLVSVAGSSLPKTECTRQIHLKVFKYCPYLYIQHHVWLSCSHSQFSEAEDYWSLVDKSHRLLHPVLTLSQLGQGSTLPPNLHQSLSMFFHGHNLMPTSATKSTASWGRSTYSGIDVLLKGIDCLEQIPFTWADAVFDTQPR